MPTKFLLVRIQDLKRERERERERTRETAAYKTELDGDKCFTWSKKH